MIRFNLLFVAFLLLPSFAGAGAASSFQTPDKAAVEGVGIDEHLGSKIDLNLNFRDEAGNSVPLKKYFNGEKPVLMALVYYECPNLCTLALNGAIDSMKNVDLPAGDNYEFIAISIDPREKPALAAEKKLKYYEIFRNGARRPRNAPAGWHFLVGNEPEIEKLAGQLGFRYKWDAKSKQFAHASAVYVLTGAGEISRYFYGVDYPSRDMKVALLEAGKGKIGTIIDKLTLFCYHYDSSTSKYVFWASRLMTTGGTVTVLTLGAFLLVLWRKERFSP